MYPVQWNGSAVNDLANVWMTSDADRRRLVTEAVWEVDRRLGTNPSEDGESRDHGRRILFVSPLALLYKVNQEGVVHVLNVWEYPSR